MLKAVVKQDYSQEEIIFFIKELKNAIWKRRSILGEIMTKHGGKTIYDYSKDFLDVNKIFSLDQRKAELIDIIKDLTAKRLGNKVAVEVADQLKRLPLISTADHHSFIQHPFFVNSNIISALPELTDDPLRYLVVLSFASVSINNASGFSRGILFHGQPQAEGKFFRLPILPDKIKMSTVYGMRPFLKQEIEKLSHHIKRETFGGNISEEVGQSLNELLLKNFYSDEILAAPDLATQITKINFSIWPRFFHGHDNQATTEKIPDLIYLEIESVVKEALIKIHLQNKSSLIYRLLFDNRFQALIKKYFDGLSGAFSLKEKSGTYLFWGRDANGHHVRLFFDDGKLHDEGRQIEIFFTPEELAKKLLAKTIFPSMMLCYITIAFYYGMKCLGGFCQVHDLTMMKEAWRKVLSEAGEDEASLALEPLQTKELGGDGMVLAYLHNGRGKITPATGLDLMISRSDTSFARYRNLSREVTLEEIMEPLLPEIYSVLYSIHEREERFISLTPEAISRATRLREKILLLLN